MVHVVYKWQRSRAGPLSAWHCTGTSAHAYSKHFTYSHAEVDFSCATPLCGLCMCREWHGGRARPDDQPQA